MNSQVQGKLVAVVGATGHTGRFVVKELERRGIIHLRQSNELTPVARADMRELARIATDQDRLHSTSRQFIHDEAARMAGGSHDGDQPSLNLQIHQHLFH